MRLLLVGLAFFVNLPDAFFPLAHGDEPAAATEAKDSGSAERTVDFPRDIRPLLSDRCFACHGPDRESREGNLSLNQKDSVFGKTTDSGEVPVVPGNANASELMRRILSDEEDEQMPPADVKKQLTDAEKQLLRQWIDEGAHWEEHWAYVPPVQTELPNVSHVDWCRTPVDRFILAQLEAEKLSPSIEADKQTLIRRVTFDLTGLPPTISELDAFLADESAQAYERVVDRLLASPGYGEHMARYWLDAARYSDTHGMHYDNYREIWPYRDWVIRAYNDNMPFDRFTVEQLAGDLLDNATNEQVVATGFSRCNVSTSEGGSIEEEVLVRNVIDRVVTTNLVFMASTFDCTRCHDHKFDPFTMKDFYNEFAFFNSIDGPALDGNVKDTYPIVTVPSADQTAALAEIDSRIKTVATQQAARLQANESSFLQWVEEQQTQPSGKSKPPSFVVPAPLEKLVGHYRFDTRHEGTFRNLVNTKQVAEIHGEMPTVAGRFGNGCQLSDETYLTLEGPFRFKADQPFSLGVWIKCDSSTSGTVLSNAGPNTGTARYRGYTLSIDDGVAAFHLSSDTNRYEIAVVTANRVIADNQWQHLCVTSDGTARAAGITIYVNGIRQSVDVKLDALYTKGNPQSTSSGAPLRIGRRDDDFPFSGGLVDDVRIYNRLLTENEIVSAAYADDVPSLLALSREERSEQQTAKLQTYYANAIDPTYIALVAAEEALLKERRTLVAEFPTTLVYRERAEPRPAYLLKRGEYDQRGEQATRAIPSFLSSMPKNAPQNRLGFAQWLVSPKHPLTSRVQVNRLWQQVFGVGIVKSSGDFGSQGTPPSHPKLLDWLAVEFRESGWDVKAMMKMFVMSATYRQSSELTPDKWKRDRDNRLLGRGTRFRLDAEMIRDQALAVSGLLVRKTGGPSVKPPQPDGIWFAVSISGIRFVADKDHEKVHRRTMYTFIKRTAGPPQMGILDGPTREICSVQRDRTDTPIQALLLMNDPQLIEAAVALAVRTRKYGGNTISSKADFLYRLCTAHHVNPAKADELLSLYRDMIELFEEDPEAAKKLTFGREESPADVDLAAWTMVANLVLNLDEVLNKN